MRLGLVTDIHNDFAMLSNALEQFRIRRVDQVITIGDSCDAFAPPDGADEVAALLSECGAMGVWGNHDFHLCREPNERCQSKFAPETLDYMQTLMPHLEIEGCFFSHKDSSVDPHNVQELWGIEEGSRDLWDRSEAAFRANQVNRQFMGHYHCWWAATPKGPIDWDGSEPLKLNPNMRYVFIIAGVFQGMCAVFDTESCVLEPLSFL